MTATAGPGHIAAFYHAGIAFRDSNGYPKGTQTSPDNVTNGTTTSMYKLTGTVKAGIPNITREIAKFRGGQAILGQMALGISDFGSSDLSLSAYDEVLNAYITASVADIVTASAHVLTAPNTNLSAPPQFVILLTAGFQTTPGGVNKFISLIYPNGQIYPPGFGFSQDSGVNPNPAGHTIVPTISNRLHTGHLVSASALALVNNSDLFFIHRSDNPIWVTTYVAQASATTFTLPYKPLSNDTTGAINIVTKNGVNFTPVSISTSTGVVTIASATGGDIYVVVFPTNFL